jgi:release factor glutamine methyltransferase
MKTNQAFTILEQAGGTTIARIITKNQSNISWLAVWIMAWRLRRGVPVAKIIHEKWFYGMPFYTNRHTLDPRPDTETLVEAVLAEYRAASPARLLDLGTGTGCLIVSIVKNLDGATGVGIDISRGAIRVAKKNVRNLGLVGRIRIFRRDFNSDPDLGRFDIIVSNPPYIALGDGRVNAAARHDPRIALYAANNGLAAYEAIAKNAVKWINPGGRIYLEIGQGQGDAVCGIFARNGWVFIKSFDDLSGIRRVLSFAR